MRRKQNYIRQSWILDKKLWRLSNQIQTYYMKFFCTQGYETQKSYCSTKTSIITSRIIDYLKQNSICIIVSHNLERGAVGRRKVVKLHCFSLMKRTVKSKYRRPEVWSWWIKEEEVWLRDTKINLTWNSRQDQDIMFQENSYRRVKRNTSEKDVRSLRDAELAAYRIVSG